MKTMKKEKESRKEEIKSENHYVRKGRKERKKNENKEDKQTDRNKDSFFIIKMNGWDAFFSFFYDRIDIAAQQVLLQNFIFDSNNSI